MHMFRRIGTLDVIRHVSSLFSGQPELIQGFNIFLPIEYRIKCPPGSPEAGVITVTMPSEQTMQITSLEGEQALWDYLFLQGCPKSFRQLSSTHILYRSDIYEEERRFRSIDANASLSHMTMRWGLSLEIEVRDPGERCALTMVMNTDNQPNGFDFCVPASTRQTCGKLSYLVTETRYWSVLQRKSAIIDRRQWTTKELICELFI